MGVDERGAFGGDGDVGVGHEVETGARAHAVDRGDDGLEHAQVAGREARIVVAACRPTRVTRRAVSVRHPAEVRPRAERPSGTGDDYGANAGVGVEPTPRLVEPGYELAIERVQTVGPVEREHDDGAVLLDLQGVA